MDLQHVYLHAHHAHASTPSIVTRKSTYITIYIYILEITHHTWIGMAMSTILGETKTGSMQHVIHVIQTFLAKTLLPSAQCFAAVVEIPYLDFP